MSLDNNTKNASKKIYSERTKLNPSTLITLYELDFRILGEGKNSFELQNINFSAVPYPYDGVTSASDTDGVLRFHNLNINLESNSGLLAKGKLFNQIIWKGKRYLPFPIQAEGYEASTRGTLPKPKISFSNQYQIPTMKFFLKLLKDQLNLLEILLDLKF